jgi:hypothetical protein
VTYIGTTATFNPTGDLAPGTTYTSTITTGAEDLAGNALAANYVWDWTTAAAAVPGDTAAPTVTITSPAALAIDVPVTQSINATFSEEMRQATMITTNFTVTETATPNVKLAGTVSYDVANNIATFNPDSNLLPDTDYTVTVTNGAQDLADNALVVPAVGAPPNPWTFRTAVAVVVPPPLAINLGSAATFGIAASRGLTSTGITVVNGDVALSPLATCSDATGLPNVCTGVRFKTSSTGLTVNGSIYSAGDAFDGGITAAAVKTDLKSAWDEARAKTCDRGLVAADELGGKSPLPGVWCNANLGLSANTVLTLDAAGDTSAVWIFQVGTTFTSTGAGGGLTRIDLINGAQARNVWFVVGADATIGDSIIWKGNVLVGNTLTLNSGAQMLGRALAGADEAQPGGAISLLDGARITVPQ